MHIGVNEKIEFVDYIKATGTQYINTGIKPTTNTTYEISVDITPQTTKTDTCLFGARPGSGSQQFIIWDGYNTDDVSHRTIPVLGSLSSAYYYAPASTKNVFKYDGTNFYCNEESIFAMTNSTGACDYPIFLFALNNGGTADSRRYQGKVHYYKIWQNGTLVRDYKPCIKDGVYCLYDSVTKTCFYSATDEFEGGTLTGEELNFNKARKIRRIYFGDENNVAQEIEKGYVGVGNLARLFFEKKLQYYGNISLSQQHTDGVAVSDSKYAIFMAGRTSEIVETVDNSLVINSATTLSTTQRYFPACTKLNDYIIVAGGQTSSSTLSSVDVLGAELVKSTATNLSMQRRQLMGATVGNYSIFAGGNSSYNSYTYRNNVDVYDSELVRTTGTSLSNARCLGTAGTIGGYAVFGGGATSSGGNATVDIYDSELARTTGTSLSQGRCFLSSAKLSNYLLFAGGGSTAGTTVAYSNIDVYDEDLVRTTPISLSVARSRMASTVLKGNAIFAGGYDGSNNQKVIDVFDENLARNEDITELPSSNSGPIGASNNKYALILYNFSNSIKVYEM